MKLTFDRTVTNNLEEAVSHEWLETNGLGGFASSTIAGVNTRRYHGLLVAATKPPVERMLLLSKLDETIVTSKGNFELGCNFYPGSVSPEGYKHVASFSKDPFPTFDFEVENVKIKKTIAAINAENTTVVIYEVLKAPGQFSMELKPFVAGRNYHSLTRANDFINRFGNFKAGVFSVRPYEGAPELFISVPGSSFVHTPDWYYNFEYIVERGRGFDFQEDLFNYGKFVVTLKKGDKLSIICSTVNPKGRDALELFESEDKRRAGLLASTESTSPKSSKDKLRDVLTLAADQFVVTRDTNQKSIIAGYPWFADWGRDTMISLPGICLVTGRFKEAKQILHTFGTYLSEGMLPNRFPDGSEKPEYNTVDASLWFFVAIYKYLQYSGDDKFVRDEMLPLLASILSWHEKGTRHNIHVDVADGLISGGEEGVQLTWMDAKVGRWVVTPRKGKPVEINALWYNALRIMQELQTRFQPALKGESYALKAKKVLENFTKLFWNEEKGYLYDCVDGDFKDATLRPNQIFALSLPFPLLCDKEAGKILGIIEEKLLTPVGLRSLGPDHPEYRSEYKGDPVTRDFAYHQGTVWGFLLGPYLTALCRFGDKHGKSKAKKIIENFTPHLSQAGIGTISEIFDGNPPHTARGCIAQAWSVAELLRAYIEDVKPLIGTSSSKAKSKSGTPVQNEEGVQNLI